MLVCPPSSPILSDPIYRRDDVAIRVLPLAGTWDMLSALRLKRLARGADLLHVHDARSHGIARLAQAFGLRCPLVVNRRVAFPIRRSLLRGWKYTKGVDAYIAVSPAVCDALSESGVDTRGIRVVRSCVDLERFIDIQSPDEDARKALGVPPGIPVIVNIGRLTSEKGHSNLIEAAARLFERGVETILVLAGDGPLRDSLHNLGVERLPSGRLFMLGHREDVPHILASASVFALTSTQEGFPVALFEAMAAGVPVVGTACGGAEAMLEEGITGRLVPPGDIEALADGLQAALQRDGQTMAMAVEARNRVHENLSPDRMADEVLEVYAKVLGEEP